MSITVPTNIPSGDRPTVAVPAQPTPVRDPLRNYTTGSPTWAPPLDAARQQARETLAQYEGVSIHDSSSMISASVALGSVLRQLLGALDAEGGAS